MNSQQCATFIKQELKKDPGMGADELANALVKRAIRFRTQDNVAVVVVDLRQATRRDLAFWFWQNSVLDFGDDDLAIGGGEERGRVGFFWGFDRGAPV